MSDRLDKKELREKLAKLRKKFDDMISSIRKLSVSDVYDIQQPMIPEDLRLGKVMTEKTLREKIEDIREKMKKLREKFRETS